MTQASGAGPIDDVIVHTRLENGVKVCIRAVRPDDEDRLRSGIAQLSQESRYLRFFSVAPTPPDHVIERLVEVDGHRHLAWGAILSDDPQRTAIGVVHAVRNADRSQRGEFAVGIVDAYHGLGLARMLTAVLLVHCRIEGIAALDAQILNENRAAMAFIQSLGGERSGSDEGVSDYVLDTGAALAKLRASEEPSGLKDVFAAFAVYLD
ncbi:GNAT family N-acetyltransferase [Novosphingobium aquiterrae]|uniref:GNAT family N-acetyltransferase n=1 Tax=Novosphingobium aquiterrae TaxID=624388 RepID=A0ABV6PKG9_9SPHN